jgi:cytochrome b561
MAIFQGSSLDIYVHWLILALGIGILISGIAVITTCRSVAGFFRLLRERDSLKTRVYRGYSRFHSYYWVAFLLFLVLHLMVTIVHVGLPLPGEPYFLAHQVVFYSAITNFLLVLVVFTSCKSFLSFVSLFTPRNLLSGNIFKLFYRFHSLFWWMLAVSFVVHIAAGIVHAVNT